jgi:hypothetical protein
MNTDDEEIVPFENSEAERQWRTMGYDNQTDVSSFGILHRTSSHTCDRQTQELSSQEIKSIVSSHKKGDEISFVWIRNFHMKNLSSQILN